ncbi:PAS domain S-box-containing protein [Abditibacterium utsteinense]|uniref:histidine kinase n=1 Tax=Abditibacterium utsteinense TaxID=1960156 RepID=A0A2S8SRD4_9BACT|nr:PAS domain S-box protein [Abditibacterium utsteinense]PQV63309.1 PAS domain S-box-containing protein [Abditibacterium utsteinense]
METRNFQELEALLAHNSEMATRVRAHNWSQTPLGAPDAWPQNLRVALGICLNSRFPMFVWWGPELINIYNDAYIPMLGKRHPDALGRPARESWNDIWTVLGPQVDAVMQRGEATWNEQVLLQMERNGFAEDTWFTWSYSPIPDGQGGVGGLFCACTEETPRVHAEAERDRLAEQRRLALDSAQLGWWHLDPPTGNVTWDKRFQTIFGASSDGLGYEAVMSLIHPDDRARVDVTTQAALDPDNSKPYAIEFRVIHPDNSVHWIYSTGQVFYAGEKRDRQHSNFVGTVADITERKQAEAALKTSEVQKGAILASALDAIITMDAQGYITEWNPAAERMFGHTRAAAIGSVLGDLIVPPSLREQHKKGLKRYLETGQEILLNQRIEAMSIRADGSEFPIEIAITRIALDGPPTFSGTIRDITQRRQSAEALLERARLAELGAAVGRALTSKADDIQEMLNHCATAMVEHLDAAFARIWTLNQDGTILQLQASAGLYIHLDGSHSRVRVGQLKIGLIAQNRQPHLTNQVIGDAQVADQEWAKREGMVAFAGFPLVVEDRLIGVAAIFARNPLTESSLQALSSISNAIALGIERKRGEEERARLLKNEQSARQEAESTNRIKDEFLATLSHELRTPLQAILGWSHLLKSGQLGEKDEESALETIERNARAQVQLIEDLLDVSRIITGKLRLDVQPLELSEVIEAAVHAVRPAAQAKNIRLQMLLDPETGRVSGDASRLQQVVWNLLTNAVKFTPKEGRVQVRLERVNSHVEIIVSDTGQGIAAEFLPHIFDRFRQADQSSTRGHGGLGLGLSIVHHLVELHGGTIQAHSAGLQQGSTFVVQLPQMIMRISPQGETALERRHPRAANSSGGETELVSSPPQLSSLRVLLVDDEADSRDLLRIVLERCDAQVITASSVADALDMFKSLHPDILISDIGMPGQDGYFLIEQVRAWEIQHGGRVPAVALTAYARVEDRVRALRAGFQVHVPKPVEPIELMAVVASLTGRIKPQQTVE